MHIATNDEAAILESAQLLEQMKALGGVWDNKRVHQLLVDADKNNLYGPQNDCLRVYLRSPVR